MPTVELHHADCLELLPTLAAESIDSCVVDGPYGIRFMGKAWDGADIVKMMKRKKRRTERPRSGKWASKGGIKKHEGAAFSAGQYDLSAEGNLAFQCFTESWAREIFRVLKPGGHLVSFSSTRTYHRMTTGIEDAGFEIRDQLAWVFGSGFPKSHNLEGEWEGWGTALKPAWEPICLARKPIVGTVAGNVAKHRTGALNIDGCRIEGEKAGGSGSRPLKMSGLNHRPCHEKEEAPPAFDLSKGRWPANLCHDGSEEVLAAFPDAPGQQAPVKYDSEERKTGVIYGAMKRGAEPSANSENAGAVGFKMKPGARRGDEGTAARFFYCAKTSRAERDAGLDEGFEKKALNWSDGTQNPGSFQSEGTDRSARNFHPTVKPTELMRWLVRLVTPKGGKVIDPMMGSGSTGRAAVLEGFDFVGCEKEAPYMAIARARIAEAQGPLFALST
jgi:DNA modification methylase